MTDASVLGIIAQHIGNVINLSLNKYINTGDRSLDTAIVVVSGAIITVLLTKILGFLQAPGAWQHIKSCGRAGPNPFEFIVEDVPSIPVIHYQTTMDDPVDAKEVFWWILKNSVSGQGQTIVQLRGNVVDVFQNGNMDKNKFKETIDLSIGGERNWVPFYKHNGAYAYYKLWGSSNDFRIGIGSDAYPCYEAVMKMIASEFTPSATNSPGNQLAMVPNEIYRVTPGNSICIGTASRGRTFDSLFFESKERFLRILAAFKNHAMYPPHIGTDNKLGILLHGPPGTGKTHAVVATANYLGYNIASIQMRDVKTCTDFDRVLDYPRDMNVFVLEEIDCVLGVIRKRGTTTEYSEEDDNAEYDRLFQVYINTDDKEQKAQLLDELQSIKKKMTNRLTLGYILEKLDGITDESGRIIIATTNHPELIDPALLRPGRLGVHLHLGKCTRQMIVDILCHYYSLDSERRKTLETIEFPEYAHSPAEVIQRIQMEESIDAVVEYLKTEPSTEEFATVPLTQMILPQLQTVASVPVASPVVTTSIRNKRGQHDYEFDDMEDDASEDELRFARKRQLQARPRKRGY